MILFCRLRLVMVTSRTQDGVLKMQENGDPISKANIMTSAPDPSCNEAIAIQCCHEELGTYVPPPTLQVQMFAFDMWHISRNMKNVPIFVLSETSRFLCHILFYFSAEEFSIQINQCIVRALYLIEEAITSTSISEKVN